MILKFLLRSISSFSGRGPPFQSKHVIIRSICTEVINTKWLFSQFTSRSKKLIGGSTKVLGSKIFQNQKDGPRLFGGRKFLIRVNFRKDLFSQMKKIETKKWNLRIAKFDTRKYLPPPPSSKKMMRGSKKVQGSKMFQKL